MSLDPETLKKGDKVKFGGKLVKEIVSDPSSTPGSIWLSGGMYLMHNDPMWELAELVNPELPTEVTFGYLGVDSNYHVDGYSYTPKNLLRFLKRDVAALEAAGVKGGEE